MGNSDHGSIYTYTASRVHGTYAKQDFPSVAPKLSFGLRVEGFRFRF